MNPVFSQLDADIQTQLKQLLQEETEASKLENLAAALLGRLLDVPIAVAKSGFQHGADAGPAGRQGRRFRVECKKYGDTTSLSDRELLGEIDQALTRDKAIEAWLLVATREVPEQLELDLTMKGEAIGVPVIILDWKERNGLSSLAALCAFGPDIVEKIFSLQAGWLARALSPVAGAAVEQIRRDLQSWSLGFETLRRESHANLQAIWNSPRESTARLGQDAAGGALEKKVKRARVNAVFDTWWNNQAKTDAPIAIVGWDGVGKTWVTLDWLIDHRDDQPIILIVPSSAAATLTGISEVTVKRFLANCLYELGGKRSQEHWLRRLDYLLGRPVDEGPVLTVFFDGLNQEPSVDWRQLLKVFEAPVFSGRVRVIVSTRNHHLHNKLSDLKGLVVPAVLAPVDVYDTHPGGELDQMLAFEGLTRADLHPDLIELACTPRLFRLVVRFRERLTDTGQLTVHRLLWEYGRDTFGVRAGRSFSEEEWHAWLKEVARTYRDGVSEFSIRTLSDTVDRPDLTTSEVFVRLSDIIDGRFATRGSSGSLQLTPTVVFHALGAALIAHLAAGGSHSSFDTVDAALSGWLDPIAGLDQRAEILRAAVSILVECNEPAASSITGVLVTAWLQTQNVTDQHRRELAALAVSLLNPLLDAIEHSRMHVHASARVWAINAMRAIPRSNGNALSTIVDRVKRWFCIVSREVDSLAREARQQRLIDRIGVDTSGPRTVLGVPLQIVDRDDDTLRSVASSLLDGFPLRAVAPVFEAAAVAFAITRDDGGWDGLKWLCLLNDSDPEETGTTLRDVSAAVGRRTPEPGVHPVLSARASALLLWLTGYENDEERASQIDPKLDRQLTYEKDYLARPERSLFRLERRHAEAALLNTGISLHVRMQRTRDLWLDPTFTPPLAFVDEVRSAAMAVDVGKLHLHSSRTTEDYWFDELQQVLARCAPDLLADLVRRTFESFRTCPPESRYWKAICATEGFVLADAGMALPARILRQSAREGDETHEAFVANELLVFEIWNLPTPEQVGALIDADLKHIFNVTDGILNVLTTEQADALLTRFGDGTPKQQHDLLCAFSLYPTVLSDTVWEWIWKLIEETKHEDRGLAFQILARADVARFGQMLADKNWSWSADEHIWVNHYGSAALIAATLALPFDQLAHRLAPWHLLEAVRRRGGDPAEVRMGAEIVGHILAAENLGQPDPGSALSADRSGNEGSLRISICQDPPSQRVEDPAVALRAALDVDARMRARRRAERIAAERIHEARRAGANFYLIDVNAEDFRPVLEVAPDLAARWLEGMDECTEGFTKRVHLAEALYLSLCEALLGHDPERGVRLWRALRQAMLTRLIGAAGIEELLHVVFRVPNSTAVAGVREELLRLSLCHSDDALYDLALAATFNGQVDWLRSQIEVDQLSRFVWRQKRGFVLSGFLSGNYPPIDDAWPAGEMRTSHAKLHRRSAQYRLIEGCARHWWRTFLTAGNASEAYAAWVLFLRSADKRAAVWMDVELQAVNDRAPLFKSKMAHYELNRSTLEHAMERRTGEINKQFLGRDIVDGIGPWANGPANV